MLPIASGVKILLLNAAHGALKSTHTLFFKFRNLNFFYFNL